MNTPSETTVVPAVDGKEKSENFLYLSVLAGNSRRDEFAPDSTLRHAIFTASVNR